MKELLFNACFAILGILISTASKKLSLSFTKGGYKNNIKIPSVDAIFFRVVGG